MVVQQRGGPLVAEERDIPVPGAEEVRIRVQACGVCHSDVVTVQGLFPIVQYPRIPGHEVLRKRASNSLKYLMRVNLCAGGLMRSIPEPKRRTGLGPGAQE